MPLFLSHCILRASLTLVPTGRDHVLSTEICRHVPHPGFRATAKAQIKNAKSKAMARKQPTAPAFEGFGFFLPRAALNLGIQVSRVDDYAPRLETVFSQVWQPVAEVGQERKMGTARTATNSPPVMSLETKYWLEANWLAVPDFSRPSPSPRLLARLQPVSPRGFSNLPPKGYLCLAGAALSGFARQTFPGRW